MNGTSASRCHCGGVAVAQQGGMALCWAHFNIAYEKADDEAASRIARNVVATWQAKIDADIFADRWRCAWAVVGEALYCMRLMVEQERDIAAAEARLVEAGAIIAGLLHARHDWTDRARAYLANKETK